MSKPTQPSEIAREVLRQLAMRRKQPTPDHFAALYNEIAGTTAVEIFPEKTLRAVVASLPRQTPEQTRLVRQFEAAVAEKSWDGLRDAVQAFAVAVAVEPPAWSVLIRDLLQQLERNHVGMTAARKRETIEHLLQSAATPDLLFTRLQSLLRSWSQGIMSEGDLDLVDGAVPSQMAAGNDSLVSPDDLAVCNRELLDWVALVLDDSIAALLLDAPELASEAGGLAAEVRGVRNNAGIAALGGRLRKFSYRLQYLAEDQAELRTALLHLLRLIIENIGEVVIDDRLLHGQVTVLLDLIDKPLNLRQLDDAERRMKDVIFKQGMMKKQLNDAQDRLKSMLATFVDRLADMSEATGSFGDKIETCVERIGRAGDISELSDVLAEVINETRQMQINAQNSRDELHAMRQRVEDSETEIARLQNELAEASDMVRHDALTGALNRKGMDEALEREIGRFQRQQSTLCLGLLDIDNFKNLNDTLGHQAGDAALVHLANVVRDTLRPQDTLARYGGEEFVVLLPETDLEEAVQVLTRLQRELTRKFFMHNNEKRLITFSAGAAEFTADETAEAALARADQAMYLAKRAGKNRVVAA
jgi:diguanylate cyclase